MLFMTLMDNFIIDAVCWNDDGSTIDSICESGEEMVKAGVWGAGARLMEVIQ